MKLSELLESPMFKADYTRKTQSLAEERKALERSAAETAQLREQLSESLKRWAVPTEAEPDWAELATKLPPQEYNLRRVQWEQRQRQKEQARAEFHAMQDQLRAEAIATERNSFLKHSPSGETKPSSSVRRSRWQTGLRSTGFLRRKSARLPITA